MSKPALDLKSALVEEIESIEHAILEVFAYYLESGQFSDLKGKGRGGERTQAPTLHDVDVKKNRPLSKSIRVEHSKDGTVFQVFANDYLIYLDSGRKKGLKPPPISAILKFIATRHLRPKSGDVNAFAYAIQRAIARDGIAGRNIIKRSLTSLDDSIGSVLDGLISDFITLLLVSNQNPK
jgi:hypothetical protein